MWIFRGNLLAICCCFLPLMCAVMDCSLSVPLPFCFVSPFYRKKIACESFYDLLADDKDPKIKSVDERSPLDCFL